MTQAHTPDADVYIDLKGRSHAGPKAFGGRVRDAEFQTVREGRRRASIRLPRLSVDGAYAFVLLTAALFVQQAGSLSGLVMSVLPLAYMAFRRRILLATLASRWPILLIPGVALASALWSEDAGVSVKYGIEMWLTAAAGVGLAVAARPEAVLKGVCLAFLLYIVVSLGLGHSVAMGMSGEAFSGLSDGKNLLADIASIGALASIAVVAIAFNQRRPGWVVLGLLGAATEFYAVFLARSAGAVLALGAGGGLLLILIALHAMPRAVRIGAAVLTVASAGILLASLRNIATAMIDLGAQMFDKDPTLTGRTYLWYRANDLIAEKPWLGRGFYAFWRQGNTDAEGLWRYAGITGRGGFNFHNTLVELTVQLGMVGAAIFCIVALIGLLSLVYRFIDQPSLPICFWIAFFVYALIRAPMEAVGYAPFYFSTALLFAAIAKGLEPSPRPLVRPRYRTQAMRLQAAYADSRAAKA